MHIYARITKVDESTGKVHGRAVQEVVDRSGEIFDYESSKPNFAKWSTDMAKATDGKSVGNVRAMHGKVAAGKLTEITFADAEKAIDVVAEIVDPGEREKCLKGVYSGFSIGGRYAKKWEDAVNKGVTRYTADPTEISLVDLPCVPSAQFTVVKADGTQELRKFETSTDDAEALAKWADGLSDAERDAVLAKIEKRPNVDAKEGEKKYGDDAHFADPKNKKYPLDTVAHIRAAWAYIHMPKNAAKYDAADVKTIKARIVAAWKEKIDKGGPPSAEKFSAASLQKALSVPANVELANAAQALLGEPAVSQFAGLLEQLAALADGTVMEAQAEGDDSKLPEVMAAALKPIAAAFLQMAQEETNEALHGQLNDDAALAMAAKDELAKVGRKHTKKTREHHAAIRDHLDKAREHLDALGADDPANDADEGTEKLAKAAGEIAKRDELLNKAAARIEELNKALVALQAQPQPVRASLHVVAKGEDLGASPAPELPPIKKADGTVDEAATAIRKALSNPVRVR